MVDDLHLLDRWSRSPPVATGVLAAGGAAVLAAALCASGVLREMPTALLLSGFALAAAATTALAIRGARERQRVWGMARLLNRTVRQSPMLVLITDVRQRIIHVNPAFTALTGHPADEALGRNACMLATEGADPEADAAFRSALRDGTAFRGPLRLRRRGGGTLWLGARITALRDDRGEVTHLVLVGEDVGQQREQEARLRRISHELEERVVERTLELARRTEELATANAELESFNYTLSHDLRRPLTTIRSFSEFLLEDYGERLDDAGRADLRRVMAAADRMDLMIRDLLRLCRVQRAPLERRAVDVGAVGRAIMDDLRRSAPERSLRFEAAGPLQTEADPELLRLVLENLLENAWKYTARREQAEVVLGAREREGRREFYVRDNGAGFDAARAREAFEPFKRLHRHEEFEGTGIGLATVKRAVERHGGEVWVDAAPERGATFWFTLAPTPADAAGSRSDRP